ncbi:MAG TPA: hypothetical protein VGQ83_13975 [Polyangia bacterium]|jgi:hypothetical protein
MADWNLGIRWTAGAVSRSGFEALRLSIWGAWRLFGAGAEYVVCVNSIPVERARRLTGAVPDAVRWRDVTHELSPLIAPFLDADMAQGVGWKFAPLRLFPDRHCLALDNDVILWERPAALDAWLASGADCLVAEDVAASYGRFAARCGRDPRNTGIRGLPPGFDLGAALLAELRGDARTLASELDEQGLQVAALSRRRPPLCVTLDEVTICSPVRQLYLGRCGAHFVGLNVRRLPPQLGGDAALRELRAHWRHQRPYLYEHVGLPLPAATPAGDLRDADRDL